MLDALEWRVKEANDTYLGVGQLKQYSVTLITSPLFMEHLDIATQNFETKISSVKLPRYYPYHPW